MFCCCICGRKTEDWREILFSVDGSKRTYCNNQSCSDQFRAIRKKESEEHRKELRREWYQNHKAEIKEKRKQNASVRRSANQKYKKTHREQINRQVSDRKKSDPIFKLKSQARNTIYQSFSRTGNVKRERCEKIIGLSVDDFALYLNSTYADVYGEAWDGIEKVHIDHIIPLATAETEEDVFRLCHYSNLRLIKSNDNLSKGAKLNYEI